MYRRAVQWLAGVAGGVMVVAGAGTAAQAAPAVPDGLRTVQVRQSLLGTHTWYQQLYRGLPVLGGFYATHTDAATGEVTVQDGRLDVHGLATQTPAVAAEHARASVAGRNGGQAAARSELAVLPGNPARLTWVVVTRTGHGTVRTVLDAGSGATLKEQNLVKEATGTGTVFDPNPVVATQNESLTDQDDADVPGLRRAYRKVALTHLDGRGTTLQGDYANNISADPVRSAKREFDYNRSQRGFEQVMGYHGITSAQEYIHALGFRDVNNEPQDYATTGFDEDNSFYDPDTDGITFGTGGVDDAEDIEVIWHEYGHAIQDDQVPGFGESEVDLEAGSIGEGFGDYWAFTMSQANSPDTARTPLACIADWDSTSYTDDVPHCLRRTDGTKMYPADLEGEVHADGEIWSRALFDINHALGRTRANRVILEAQFCFDPNTTMPAAARTTVKTARALYGQGAADQVRAAFHARGIL
ncbi:M36 family metallopeptidase [Dactylosporangium vinaceum]|uniref:M36 family metallopeptidase n=1 Tax=Dactylosporangium vinaceum TaxID=53362 RepID=A0ABV5MRE2_9ACTN|nr:M36 family metallopeptidase [Dactylosporangium vinaceum]UAC00499.1 M36 family metallopeptidase [Dactylosporangium vinaceum]